jgi:hypothetical protein
MSYCFVSSVVKAGSEPSFEKEKKKENYSFWNTLEREVSCTIDTRTKLKQQHKTIVASQSARQLEKKREFALDQSDSSKGPMRTFRVLNTTILLSSSKFDAQSKLKYRRDENKYFFLESKDLVTQASPKRS